MVGPLQAGAPRSIAGLYALTPERSDIDAMTECVAAALDGGATTIQYRNKTAAPKLRYDPVFFSRRKLHSQFVNFKRELMGLLPNRKVLK